jgi:hypothetical protein
MSYATLEQTEPTILVGGLTSVIGFVALLGADVNTLQSAATALGVSGTQALFTRQGVYSPKSVEQIKSAAPSSIPFGELLGTGGSALQREPAVAVGTATLLAGFLVQFFAGVGLTEALVSATGIAGAQGVATRGRVYSPASTRRVAAAQLLSIFPADAQGALNTAKLLPASAPKDQDPPLPGIAARLWGMLSRLGILRWLSGARRRPMHDA